MPINVLLTSKSNIKTTAVMEIFKEMFGKRVCVYGVDCYKCELPEQPVVDAYNSGFHFAKERMNYAKLTKNFDDFDFIFSIENAIDISLYNVIEDKCFVLIYSKGILAHGESFGINFDVKYFDELEKNHEMVHHGKKLYGYGITVGKLMSIENPKIDHRNWMKILNGIDRIDQIKDAIKKAFNKLEKYEIVRNGIDDSFVRHKDFPTVGVLFYDMFPLFENSKMFQSLVKYIANQYKYDDITHIVGLESRGFCLGVAIAVKLKIGFVPIRKAGKLPGSILSATYNKEYGEDKFEIQTHLQKDSRVLIIDDAIATGGSMHAAVSLVNGIGCTIVDCCVLKDVLPTNDKPINIPHTVLLQKQKIDN